MKRKAVIGLLVIGLLVGLFLFINTTISYRYDKNKIYKTSSEYTCYACLFEQSVIGIMKYLEQGDRESADILFKHSTCINLKENTEVHIVKIGTNVKGHPTGCILVRLKGAKRELWTPLLTVKTKEQSIEELFTEFYKR